MNSYTPEEILYKKRRLRKIRLYTILGGILILAALIIYVIAASPIFLMKIEIEGSNRFSSDRLLSAVNQELFRHFWPRLLGADHYLSWIGKIDIREPLLAKLVVNRDFWNKKIILAIEERQPYGVWCYQNVIPKNCYWFDESGIIFEPAPRPEGYLILRVDSDGPPANLGELAIKNEWFGIFKKIVNFFKKSGLAVSDYIIMSDLQEIRANILASPTIRFSFRFDPKNSLAALESYLAKNKIKGIEYIDLTADNRLYVKLF